MPHIELVVDTAAEVPSQQEREPKLSPSIRAHLEDQATPKNMNKQSDFFNCTVTEAQMKMQSPTSQRRYSIPEEEAQETADLPETIF